MFDLAFERFELVFRRGQAARFFQLYYPVLELVLLGQHQPDGLGHGVREVAVVEVYPGLALLFDDTAGHAHHGSAGRHGLDHHRPGTDARVLANGDGAEDDGAGADDYTVADGGMALLFGQSGAAQHHALVHQHIVAYLGGLAYHHARSMVDKKPPADGGARVYLYLREKAVDLGDESRCEIAFMPVEEIGHAVPPQRMQPGVKKKNLPGAARRRVALHGGADVFSHQFKAGAHDYSYYTLFALRQADVRTLD